MFYSYTLYEKNSCCRQSAMLSRETQTPGAQPGVQRISQQDSKLPLLWCFRVQKTFNLSAAAYPNLLKNNQDPAWFLSPATGTLSDICIYFFGQASLLLSLSQGPSHTTLLVWVEQIAKRIANDFSSQMFFNRFLIKFIWRLILHW